MIGVRRAQSAHTIIAEKVVQPKPDQLDWLLRLCGVEVRLDPGWVAWTGTSMVVNTLSR